jgi:hypothetical protein
MGNKEIERICGNCKLFNPNRNECSVVVLIEGHRYKLPVDPEDKCFYEQEYFDPTMKAKQDFADDIKEVKFWVENEKGEKVTGRKWWQFWRKKENSIVKFEYPEDFFGKEKKLDDLESL